MQGRYRKRFHGKEAIRLLHEALIEAVGEKHLSHFLEGMLTEDERAMVAQRLMVAFGLTHGWSYRMISGEIGASLRTIARVHRWLEKERPHYRRSISLRYRKNTQKTAHDHAGHNILSLSTKGIFQSVTGTRL